MIAARIEDIMRLADDLATARVQRFVAQLQEPENRTRMTAVDRRVQMLRAKLRAELERTP